MPSTQVVTKRSTAVLDLQESGIEEARWFTMRVDGKITRTLTLSTQDWVDFGSPQQITVTVEPGATLADKQK